MGTITLELRHIDTCTPDYFLGSNLPYLQVRIGSNTTPKELQDALVRELHEVADTWGGWERPDDWYDAAEQAIHNWCYPIEICKPLFVSTWADDDDDDVYAYFALVDIS